MMKTISLSRFEYLTRFVALMGSAIATLVFGIVFATEKVVPYQIERFLAGQDGHIGLPIYLAILLVVFVGYFIAGSKQYATTGSLLTIGAVGGIYAWCQLEFDFSPGPYLIVLACPALLHLSGFLLHRQSLKGAEASLQNSIANYDLNPVSAA